MIYSFLYAFSINYYKLLLLIKKIIRTMDPKLSIWTLKHQVEIDFATEQSIRSRTIWHYPSLVESEEFYVHTLM